MPRVTRIALPDAFPRNYGVQKDLFEIYGLLPEQIAATVTAALGRVERAA
jgi:transketolase C-terminal domain/subunit